MGRSGAGPILLMQLLVSSIALAQARGGQQQEIAALVGQLGDPARREAAAQRLRKIGRPAWEPLRLTAKKTKAGEPRQRILALWEELVDASARALLARHSAGQQVSWALEYSSNLLPYLRCYKARGTRYPMAAILDLEAQAELGALDQETMNLLLKRAKLRCHGRPLARQVAELFVRLKYQPYSPRGLKLAVRRGGGGHRMTGRFSRTLPWSSPDRPMVVTSRTEERTIRLSLSRRCRFRELGETAGKAVYSTP